MLGFAGAVAALAPARVNAAGGHRPRGGRGRRTLGPVGVLAARVGAVLGDGYYQFNWKTPKTYARSCKVVSVETDLGLAHEAFFRFTK